MNQAIRERAEAYQKDMFILDGYLVRFDSVGIRSPRYVAFKAGVEWMLEQLSVIKLPSKLMPETGINLENGQILATTDDCIIFYGNGAIPLIENGQKTLDGDGRLNMDQLLKMIRFYFGCGII